MPSRSCSNWCAMHKQRLFFALWPESAVRKQLARHARQQQTQSGRIHHPEDLHMTLVFLGQVTDEQLPCVQRAGDGITAGSFSMTIDNMGYWPRPRILWCGSSVATEPLLQLVGQLQQALQTCGFAPERRRYKPHVTLLRKARRAETLNLQNPIEWPVREFVLAASGDGPVEGPRYRILHRWALS